MDLKRLHLRYFDRAPQHQGLWKNVDAAFQAIPGKTLSPEHLEQQIEIFFTQKLAQIPDGQQAFIVFHIHEPRASGGYWQIQSDWFSHIKAQVFFLLVTGGAPRKAREIIQAQNLNPSQVAAYPYALDDIPAWSPYQIKAWQRFMWSLRAGHQAYWPLLEGLRHGPSYLKELIPRFLRKGPHAIDPVDLWLIRALAAETARPQEISWSDFESSLTPQNPEQRLQRIRHSPWQTCFQPYLE